MEWSNPHLSPLGQDAPLETDFLCETSTHCKLLPPSIIGGWDPTNRILQVVRLREIQYLGSLFDIKQKKIAHILAGNTQMIWSHRNNIKTI
jgi:hypothetical protein